MKTEKTPPKIAIGRKHATKRATSNHRFTMKQRARDPMFELTPQHTQPQKTLSLVEIVMDDGTLLKGEIETPVEGGIAVMLNGLNQFIELKTYDGELHYISKDSMRTVRPMKVPEKENFTSKLTRFLRSDPYEVLGVTKDAEGEAIEAAYQRQLKNFHEILDYLDSSYKCLNAAYKEIEGQMTTALPKALGKQRPAE